MSGKNPNVFYETGYAHALGKSMLRLTQDLEDVPFDLRFYPHIIYGRYKLPELRRALKVRLRQWLADSWGWRQRVDVPLSIEVDGTDISTSPEILKPVESKAEFELRFEIGVRNRGTLVLPAGSFQVGLLPKDDYTRADGFAEEQLIIERQNVGGEATETPRRLYVFSTNPVMFPDSRQVFRCVLQGNGFKGGDTREFTVRTFTEAGPRDYDFRLKGTTSTGQVERARA